MVRLPSRFAVFLVVGAVFGLTFIAWPPARSAVGRAVVTIIRPVGAFGRWVSERSGLSIGGQQSDRERQELRQQVTELTVRLYEANLLLESSQAVEQLQNFARQTKRNLLLAHVITTSPDPGIQSIVVDQGSDDGVAVNQIAVAENGLVIGRVVNVRQNISTILLLSDRQSVIAARLQNKAQSAGVIRGERGLTLRMEFIPKNDDVQPGQIVVTAGLDADTPPDLLIGVVSATASRSGDLFQQATIKPAAELQRIKTVGIVKL